MPRCCNWHVRGICGVLGVCGIFRAIGNWCVWCNCKQKLLTPISTLVPQDNPAKICNRTPTQSVESHHQMIKIADTGKYFRKHSCLKQLSAKQADCHRRPKQAKNLMQTRKPKQAASLRHSAMVSQNMQTVIGSQNSQTVKERQNRQTAIGSQNSQTAIGS